jgi:threonine/homoserine/homoserine lactone efflux protein
MAFSIISAFWLVSILFVITPGVDWAYAISAGLTGRRVVPAVTGLLCGHLFATVIVAAGIGALLAHYPVAILAITMMGAGYLLWIGVSLLLHPPVPKADQCMQVTSSIRWLTKGVCVSGLNPKVFLLFLALLPQFTDPRSDWPVSLQILFLGAIHIVGCGAVYLLVGFGAQAVLKTRPNAAQWMSRFSGCAMVVIAISLVVEQLSG